MTQKQHSFNLIDLSAVIEEATSELEVLIQETGARVEVSGLPALEADKTGMRQLFQNLIGNAIKYAKSDVKPFVIISCELLDGICSINVEDNGIGFDEKYLDQIFRPFKRLHGKISRYEGTGMGLAICRKIVEMHGGTITARSTPGEGSSFIVTLPLKQENGSASMT
jgi:signal transduction histidine kinase